MKKKISILLIIFLVGIIVAISGCTNPNKYDNNNYSYSYPSSWSITYEDIEGQDLNGTGLLMGKIYTDTLENGQTPMEYLHTICNDPDVSDLDFVVYQERYSSSDLYSNWRFTNPKEINGNTYVQAEKFSKDSTFSTHIGAFVKDKTIYIIQIRGKGIASDFESIRDSFKIK